MNKTAAATDRHMMNGNVLYKHCVQAVHKKKLSGRKDRVWRERLGS